MNKETVCVTGTGGSINGNIMDKEMEAGTVADNTSEEAARKAEEVTQEAEEVKQEGEEVKQEAEKEIKQKTEEAEQKAEERAAGIKSTGRDRGVLLYLVFVFVSTYLYEYIFVIRFLKNNPQYSIASISMRLALAMFLPALSAAAARYATGERFKNSYISFDFKDGRYRYYLIAWFAPVVLTLAGCFAYYIIFPGDYSPEMEYIIKTYEKQGLSGITPEGMRLQALSQAITSILIAPILNCVTCFGEEWGWRGYLLPRLRDKLASAPLMIVMGVIWGLWHAPLIVAGHNYGYDYFLYPFTGIAAMILFCFSIGTILSYVTLKTGSCVPAVIGHGAINGFSAIGIYFSKTGGHLLLGPTPAGVVAGLPCLITAVILIHFMKKDEQK